MNIWMVSDGRRVGGKMSGAQLVVGFEVGGQRRADEVMMSMVHRWWIDGTLMMNGRWRSSAEEQTTCKDGDGGSIQIYS